MRKSRRNIPEDSFRKLIRETARLRQELRRLVDKYPEDHLDADDRIFNRILTNDWRHAIGGLHGPHGSRYVEAAKWVDAFDGYTRRLREGLFNTPQRIAQLPLANRVRLSATDCIRHLELQEQMLETWSLPESTTELVQTPLQRDLAKLVKKLGMKTVATESGLSRDTLSDYLAGRTTPHAKTLESIRNYVKRKKAEQKQAVGT